MLIFIVLCITAVAVYCLSGWYFRKNALKNIVYKVRVSTHETFEGTDFFLYESIANAKKMALPNVRVEVRLPDGVDFCLYDKQENGVYQTSHLHNIESVFVLKPGSCVERRWRVSAKKRGIYYFGAARLVACDIFGTNKQSVFYDPDASYGNAVTILPATIDLDEYFAPVIEPMGDETTRFSLSPDPLLIAGTRDYRKGDPFNSINWKASARMHELMVNIEEYTEKRSFDLIFNLQSRGREDAGEAPESTGPIELGISVCASVFDMACAGEIPIRLICNTVSKQSSEKYFISDRFKGRADALDAMRMLAEIEMRISCRVEDMFEDILNERLFDRENKSAVLVTAYIDETIVDFVHKMQNTGVEIVVFATTGMRTMPEIPDDITVFYNTWR